MTDITLLDDVTSFEQILHFVDPPSSLDGFIAIHSTALGPALGGARFRPYGSSSEALRDALRLGRGMTYKAAAAGLDLGGGKAVINGDPALLRSEELFLAFGRVVESLGGRYITAEDVGTTVEDMAIVAKETTHVVGQAVDDGGLGDPSPSTALGVLVSIQAALAELDGSDSLVGRSVAVAGAGKVGAALARLLAGAGATVHVSDVDSSRVDALVRELGVVPVDVQSVHGLECDVFSPCALGGVLDEETIAELRCRAVVGAANNQLAHAACADLLAARGVLYVPDFVANAGGLVHVACEGRMTLDAAHQRVRELRGRVTSLLRLAADTGISTQRAAEELAEERLRSVRVDASPAGAYEPWIAPVGAGVGRGGAGGA